MNNRRHTRQTKHERFEQHGWWALLFRIYMHYRINISTIPESGTFKESIYTRVSKVRVAGNQSKKQFNIMIWNDKSPCHSWNVYPRKQFLPKAITSARKYDILLYTWKYVQFTIPQHYLLLPGTDIFAVTMTAATFVQIFLVICFSRRVVCKLREWHSPHRCMHWMLHEELPKF